MAKPLTRLRRLDLEGGEVELDPTHADRLLRLEARMGVKNFEIIPTPTDDADQRSGSAVVPKPAEPGRAGKGGKG